MAPNNIAREFTSLSFALRFLDLFIIYSKYGVSGLLIGRTRGELCVRGLLWYQVFVKIYILKVDEFSEHHVAAKEQPCGRTESTAESAAG